MLIVPVLFKIVFCMHVLMRYKIYVLIESGNQKNHTKCTLSLAKFQYVYSLKKINGSLQPAKFQYYIALAFRDINLIKQTLVGMLGLLLSALHCTVGAGDFHRSRISIVQQLHWEFLSLSYSKHFLIFSAEFSFLVPKNLAFY